jgi:hypothetical protein
MPALNIDTLDDQIILDSSPLFSGGQVSNSRPAALAPDQFWLLQNADISIAGRVITRRGTTAIGVNGNFANPVQGLAYYQTPAYTNLVAVVNGDFKIWDGTNWANPPAGIAYNTTLPVQMVQGTITTGDVLFIAQSGALLSYWNGVGLVSMTNGTNTTAPVRPAFIEWHTGRLVAAGMSAVPDNLSFSKIFEGNVWDHVNWDMRIGVGDGDPITGLRSWTNFNLIVFKQHSVWVVNCDPSLADPTTGNVSGFQINPVHKRIGCAAPNSAVQVGADVFFLSESGVRSVARTLASESQDIIGPALSDPIKDIIIRINQAALKNVVGFFWNDRYLLSVPMDTETYPNYTLVYNTLTKSWSGYWSGIFPTAYTRRVHGSTAKLCIGNAAGRVSDFMDYIPESSETDDVYQDQGTDYPTNLISRGFSCGDEDTPKTGMFARVEFNKASADVNVSAILDGADPMLLPPSPIVVSSSLTLPLVVPFTLPTSGTVSKSLDIQHFGQWRVLQLKIASTAKKLSVNRVGIGAFMDTFVLQE